MWCFHRNSLFAESLEPRRRCRSIKISWENKTDITVLLVKQLCLSHGVKSFARYRIRHSIEFIIPFLQHRFTVRTRLLFILQTVKGLSTLSGQLESAGAVYRRWPTSRADHETEYYAAKIQNFTPDGRRSGPDGGSRKARARLGRRARHVWVPRRDECGHLAQVF